MADAHRLQLLSDGVERFTRAVGVGVGVGVGLRAGARVGVDVGAGLIHTCAGLSADAGLYAGVGLTVCVRLSTGRGAGADTCTYGTCKPKEYLTTFK